MSYRERACLKLLLQEYSVREIATKLTLSLSLVEKSLRSLRKKFKVKRNIGLVKVATQCDFDYF